MKQYAYFPGCSLEKIALGYHLSALETTRQLGIELRELEDWNCCGATTYFHVDELLAYALSGRNLAMAEAMGLDVVCPCAACYKNLSSASADLKKDPDLAEHINFALEEDNLKYTGRSSVRHLMELFVEPDVLPVLQSRVTMPLTGLRVAAYYGCQVLRPRKEGATFAQVEEPNFFEGLLSTVGASPVDFPLRLRCCGGSLIMTNREAALSLVRDLLLAAVKAGAGVIATACPMCQVNLECYQAQVNQEFGTEISLPVLYFTQLIGLAMGMPAERLGIGKELVSAAPLLSFQRSAQPA